jgi:hypothetical protein
MTAISSIAANLVARAADARVSAGSKCAMTPLQSVRRSVRESKPCSRRASLVVTRAARVRDDSLEITGADESMDSDVVDKKNTIGRRAVGVGVTAFTAAMATTLLSPKSANATPPRATFQVSEDQFRPLPGTNPPIMFADIQGGGGTEGGAKDGTRVAIHFDVKFRRITIATSRQGAGVTGGTPYGFTVGVPAGTPGGPFIKCLNEGIKGMSPGQFRRLIVPPEYAYGKNQVQVRIVFPKSRHRLSDCLPIHYTRLTLFFYKCRRFRQTPRSPWIFNY